MKKFLKIFVIIIFFLLAGFFLMGILVPEVKYEAQVTVNRPLHETFLLFNDPRQITEWIPEVKKMEIVDAKAGMVGTKIKMLLENKGKKMEMTETITAWEENHRTAFQFDAMGMLKINDITFTGDSASTTIHASYFCQGSNPFYRSLFSFFKSKFMEIDYKYLQQFKTFAERQN
jgi:hypothetical protein